MKGQILQISLGAITCKHIALYTLSLDACLRVATLILPKISVRTRIQPPSRQRHTTPEKATSNATVCRIPTMRAHFGAPE